MAKKEVLVKNRFDGQICAAWLDEDLGVVVNHRGEEYDFQKWQVVEGTPSLIKKIFVLFAVVVVLAIVSSVNIAK